MSDTKTDIGEAYREPDTGYRRPIEPEQAPEQAPEQDQYETRTLRIGLIPKGEPIFCERGFTVEITDEAAGEFVMVAGNEIGKLCIDPSEWPALRSAIEQMIGECREGSE